MPSFNNKDPQLLRAIILQHYQHPANMVEKMPEKNGYLSFHNKSTTCIDDFTVYLRVTKGVVTEALFSGLGCAISTAAASIATVAITGKPVAEATAWLDNFTRMINGWEHDEDMLGEAVAFHTINQLPSRIKCALAVPEPLQTLLRGPKQ